MDAENSLVQAMNDVLLEEEEEGGIVVTTGDHLESHKEDYGFDANLCVVGRFLTEGRVDFQALQQTLAAIWKPGRGVYIKELETNLYLFQFYHEVDVKRIMEGCPWSFNRRALIMKRLAVGDNPRNVMLNKMEIWVQVYDLKVGFMSESILQSVGNSIGSFVSSCSSNFNGVWRDYFRIRVALDVNVPLKRKMKIKQSNNEWFWITFKYENVPVFCFICGVLGHSEKFCGKLFESSEGEIVKPYGEWLRAPLRRQVKPIGAKWLRNGFEQSSRRNQTDAIPVRGGQYQHPNISPQNQGSVIFLKNGDSGNTGIGGNTGADREVTPTNQQNPNSSEIIIEPKKRKMVDGVGLNNTTGQPTNIILDVHENTPMQTDQDHTVISGNDPKNVPEASIQEDARLSQ